MPKDDVDWALAATAERAPRYARYRRYYDGDHDLTFSTEKFLNAFGPLVRAFSDNLTPVVVDALADRLRVEGFSGAASAAAEKLWKANKFFRRQGELFLEAVRSGDAYLLVWPDRAATPRFWPQTPANVAVDYDTEEDPTLIVRSAKVWQIQAAKVWRVNLYYADHIERWMAAATDRPESSNPFRPLDDDLGPELPNEWGVNPMFHLPNNASPGSFGSSELSDVLPLQDALNKTWADLLVAMEYVALPMRWGTGVEAEIDPDTGRERAIETGSERFWRVASSEARLGQFDSADLTGFLGVQRTLRMEIAVVSGTPAHYFVWEGGEPPSGESLKTLDARLTKKTEDRHDTFGDILVGATELGLRQQRSATGSEGIDLEVKWAPAADRDELRETEVAAGRFAIHGSRRLAMAELGYTDAEIAAAEADRSTNAAQMADAMLASMDRGGVDVEMAGLGR